MGHYELLKGTKNSVMKKTIQTSTQDIYALDEQA